MGKGNNMKNKYFVYLKTISGYELVIKTKDFDDIKIYQNNNLYRIERHIGTYYTVLQE